MGNQYPVKQVEKIPSIKATQVKSHTGYVYKYITLQENEISYHPHVI